MAKDKKDKKEKALEIKKGKTPAKASGKAVAKAPKKRNSFVQFFRDMGAELKKATWPTKQELARYTGIVILFICVFAVVVGLMDLGLTKLLALIIG